MAHGLQPVVSSAKALAEVWRATRRKFRGAGGIAVHQTPDEVVIALSDTRRRYPGGGGMAFWLGAVIPYGGFSDHRYRVQSIRISNAGGNPNEAAEWDYIGTGPVPPPPEGALVRGRGGKDGGRDGAPVPEETRIETVTNLAEELTRGHLLHLGEVVQVWSFADEGTPPVTRYVTFATPIQNFMWVQITSASEVHSRRWRYTGFEQVELADGAFDTPADPRMFTRIYNSVEAYNEDGRALHGNSVNEGGSSYPAGFDLVRMRGHPVVPIRPWYFESAGEVVWFTNYENANDGTCD